MALAKQVILDKTEAISLVKGFFDAFLNCCNQARPPLAAEFERALSRNFQIFGNGHLLGRNLTEYLNRIERFQKRYSHCDISFIKEDAVFGDNHIACHYKVELTGRNGQKTQVIMMAIATIEDHKICQWKQVAHEKGTGTWDV